MAAFIPREGEGRLPPLPLSDTTSVQPRTHHELNALRASIESTIEQHLHERTIAFLLTNANAVLHQKATAPFYAVNGAQYTTIHEFSAGVQRLQPHEFAHHVTPQRNDFANWITDCFPEPAKKLGEVLRNRGREEVLELLQRLEEYSKLPVQTRAPVGPVPSIPAVPKGEPAVRVPIQEIPAPRPPVRPPFEPLPPAPVSLPTPAEHVQQELQYIQQLLRTDLPAAREAFISIRTYVWQQLSEHDRKAMLPQLRELYLALVAAGKY